MTATDCFTALGGASLCGLHRTTWTYFPSCEISGVPHPNTHVPPKAARRPTSHFMIIAFAVAKHASEYFPADRADLRNCGFPTGEREAT